MPRNKSWYKHDVTQPSPEPRPAGPAKLHPSELFETMKPSALISCTLHQCPTPNTCQKALLYFTLSNPGTWKITQTAEPLCLFPSAENSTAPTIYCIPSEILPKSGDPAQVLYSLKKQPLELSLCFIQDTIPLFFPEICFVQKPTLRGEFLQLLLYDLGWNDHSDLRS